MLTLGRSLLLASATLSPSASTLATASCSDGGVKLPPQVRIDQQQLQLNGYGTRDKWVWPVYVASLYLSEPQGDPKSLLQAPGPKRLSLHFLHEVPAAKLAEGWLDGFNANHTAAELAALQPALQQSATYFTDMQPGDRVDLDYSPDQGTRLMINGSLKGTLTGEAFYQGVLKVWLGEQPTQNSLRRCLLGIRTTDS
ncbi:chalcone isomerase family protein [Motiliproteus sediminis]|uniref:chalcone isomerase family protein n=1 Tax=Motiliproteus sediminis TaxID=1468178 RepID=UPI001AEF402F|nr:chalcone isomerase family protein [Motiliproteus sediminis]